MTDEPRSISAPPIHPLAAFATIALDGIFGAFEIVDPFLLAVTCIVVGLLGFSATTMVQRYLAHDGWGTAIAKGLVMGIVAGVPYPIAGTVVGAPLLVWAGIHQWVKLPGSGSQPLLDNPEEKR
jgi:chromate transport protein ChrA